MRVVTWMSPGPNEGYIDICPDCEQRLQGQWPKDGSGREFCTVSRGLHAGACDVHPTIIGGTYHGKTLAEVRRDRDDYNRACGGAEKQNFD